VLFGALSTPNAVKFAVKFLQSTELRTAASPCLFLQADKKKSETVKACNPKKPYVPRFRHSEHSWRLDHCYLDELQLSQPLDADA